MLKYCCKAFRQRIFGLAGSEASERRSLPVTVSEFRAGLCAYDFQKLGVEVFASLATAYGLRECELWPGNPNGPVHVICVSTGSSHRLFEETDPAVAVELVETGITRAIEVDAPFVMIYPGVSHFTARTAGELIRDQLGPSLVRARLSGITLLVENLFDVWGVDPAAGDPFRTAVGISTIVETVSANNFAIAFDPCNFVVAGTQDIADAYEILRPYIKYVHLKDVVPVDPTEETALPGRIFHDPIGGHFRSVPLGQGIVPVADSVSALIRDGYDGLFMLELAAPPSAVEIYLRDSLKYLRSLRYL